MATAKKTNGVFSVLMGAVVVLINMIVATVKSIVDSCGRVT